MKWGFLNDSGFFFSVWNSDDSQLMKHPVWKNDGFLSEFKSFLILWYFIGFEYTFTDYNFFLLTVIWQYGVKMYLSF